MSPNDGAEIVGESPKGPEGQEEGGVGGAQTEVLPKKMAIKGVEA